MVIYTWMPTIKTTVGTKRRVHTNAIKTTDPDKYPGVYSTKQIPINIVGTKLNCFIYRTHKEKITLTATAKKYFYFLSSRDGIIFDTIKNEMTLRQDAAVFVFIKEKCSRE